MSKALALTKSGALKVSESDVTKAAIDYLTWSGWHCRRMQSGLFARPNSKSRIRIGEVGMFDWEVLRPTGTSGLVNQFYLELKTPGEKLSSDQESWMKEKEAGGFLCTVQDCAEGVQYFVELNFE